MKKIKNLSWVLQEIGRFCRAFYKTFMSCVCKILQVSWHAESIRWHTGLSLLKLKLWKRLLIFTAHFTEQIKLNNTSQAGRTKNVIQQKLSFSIFLRNLKLRTVPRETIQQRHSQKWITWWVRSKQNFNLTH